MAIAEPRSWSRSWRPTRRRFGRCSLAGRALLLQRLAPVVELHYDATSAVCAGFSYTGDLRGNFVNLAAYSNHVTLVFAWGSKLGDPERRLKGEGKQVRHMRLADLEALRDPYVLDLVRQASDAAPRWTRCGSGGQAGSRGGSAPHRHVARPPPSTPAPATLHLRHAYSALVPDAGPRVLHCRRPLVRGAVPHHHVVGPASTGSGGAQTTGSGGSDGGGITITTGTGGATAADAGGE